MVPFSTTPPTHNVNILLKSIKIIFVYIAALSSKKKQRKSFSENLCFLYKHAKPYFFMSSSMDLLGPLTAIERFVFNIFLDNKIGINYFELIGFMNCLTFSTWKNGWVSTSPCKAKTFSLVRKSFCMASAYHGFTFPN